MAEHEVVRVLVVAELPSSLGLRSVSRARVCAPGSSCVRCCGAFAVAGVDEISDLISPGVFVERYRVPIPRVDVGSLECVIDRLAVGQKRAFYRPGMRTSAGKELAG